MGRDARCNPDALRVRTLKTLSIIISPYQHHGNSMFLSTMLVMYNVFLCAGTVDVLMHFFSIVFALHVYVMCLCS